MIIIACLILFLYKCYFLFFLYRGSLSLYEIENKQGSQETQITSVSGGQGSWMCKKVTVQVSVHRQVRKFGFILIL